MGSASSWTWTRTARVVGSVVDHQRSVTGHGPAQPSNAHSFRPQRRRVGAAVNRPRSAVGRLGAAAVDLCWVAAGRLDGFYEHKLQPWDSAAGFLILEEAGGKVTDFEGNRYSPYQQKIVATNGLIHEQLLGVINDVRS